MTLVNEMKEHSLAKGVLAGLIGGVAALGVKAVAETLYANLHEMEQVEAFAGHPLHRSLQTLGSESMHWGFGVAAGAAYGALAEFYPAAAAKEGASFGLTLATLTQGNALSSAELAIEAEEQTLSERTTELSSYVVFGLVTEFVRRRVRKAL